MRHGDAEGAEVSLRRVLELDPRHADAQHLLGVSCFLLGRHDEAVTHIRAALRVNGAAGYFADLALALGALGRDDEAAHAYRDAIRMGLRQPRIHNNLGNVLNRQGDTQGAIDQYRLAIAVDPGYSLAYKNLATVLAETGATEDALAAFEQALKLDARFGDAWLGYGGLLERGKRFAEAEVAYRRAGRPDLARHACRQLARWDELGALDAAVEQALAGTAPPAMSPWVLLSLEAAGPDLQRSVAARFAASRWPRELAAPPLVARGHRLAAAGVPVRIGYLSADFKDHATMHLLAGVLEHHDPARVDVRLYSYGPRVVDAWRDRISRMPLPCHEIGELGDAEAAERIARDGVEILVDLKGYTTGARLGITARRPAPVIVNWLGYPGTLGEPRLADYLIGDAIVTPPEAQAAYSETLALLPGCYQPNDALDAVDAGAAACATPTRTAAGLPERGFVFCSFNQTFKFAPDLFGLWCELLRAVPDSVLWLAQPAAPDAEAQLRGFAAVRGVTPERVIFAARLPRDAHLARLRLADLALDTYPVGSHTTASDALRAGVPMVTRLGASFASRVGASLLHAVGLDALVTPDASAYRELALTLATDPARLAEVRATLDAGRHDGSLFDPAGFARRLEALYHAIRERERHRATSPGAGPEVPPAPLVLDAHF